MKLLCTCFYSFLIFTTPAVADLKDENLLQNLPPGYKIDYQIKKGNMLMTEMVPAAETVHNWTEMVTTQVFLGWKNKPPAQFQKQIGDMWLAACKGSAILPITTGKENGYDFSIWLQSCPLNPSSSKPEKTWFKAISGNDSFYVVQKAFKFDPTKEQVVQWMQYFRTVAVCDSRLPDRACTKFMK